MLSVSRCFFTHLGLTLLVPSCSVDPFAKKDWYEVKAPSTFSHRGIGKTLVTRTQGTKVRFSTQNLKSTRLNTYNYSEIQAHSLPSSRLTDQIWYTCRLPQML